MNSRYWRYLTGATAARTGDEMSGPALLLLAFAITGTAAAGSALLAGLTIAAALGGSARGALLLSAVAVVSLTVNSLLARRPPREPDRIVLASTLVLCVTLAAAAAVAPGWYVMLAVAAGGLGEGPQLPALLAVRHREAPPAMRAQTFTTAASLKIGGLAAGSMLAGPLASHSVTACLLVASAAELCAAVTYAVTG